MRPPRPSEPGNQPTCTGETTTMALTTIDPDADSHRHSIERVFPKLGETATTAEVIDRVGATR